MRISSAVHRLVTGLRHAATVRHVLRMHGKSEEQMFLEHLRKAQRPAE